MYGLSVKPDTPTHTPYAGLAAIMLVLGLLAAAAPAGAQSPSASGPSQENLATLGKLPVKFQLAIEKSIVREDDFGLDWNIRFNIIPVMPGLVKKPLF